MVSIQRLAKLQNPKPYTEEPQRVTEKSQCYISLIFSFCHVPSRLPSIFFIFGGIFSHTLLIQLNHKGVCIGIYCNPRPQLIVKLYLLFRACSLVSRNDKARFSYLFRKKRIYIGLVLQRNEMVHDNNVTKKIIYVPNFQQHTCYHSYSLSY